MKQAFAVLLLIGITVFVIKTFIYDHQYNNISAIDADVTTTINNTQLPTP